MYKEVGDILNIGEDFEVLPMHHVFPDLPSITFVLGFASLVEPEGVNQGAQLVFGPKKFGVNEMEVGLVFPVVWEGGESQNMSGPQYMDRRMNEINQWMQSTYGDNEMTDFQFWLNEATARSAEWNKIGIQFDNPDEP